MGTLNHQNQIVVTGFVAYISGFRDSANAPPIIPKINPMMNPPPVITLGIENITIIMPHAFFFTGLKCSIIAPINTITPTIKPIAVRLYRTVVSLADDPGSVGIISGNHLAATPKRVVLLIIKIPAIKDKIKALFDFSFGFIIFTSFFLYTNFMTLFPDLFCKFSHPVSNLIPITQIINTRLNLFKPVVLKS